MRRLSRIIGVILLAAALLCTSGVAFALPLCPDTALSLGSYGEDVALLQTELSDMGLYEGDVTGLYDESTLSAVGTLQDLLGVPTDGKFGELTYKAFVDALTSGLIAYNAREEQPASVLFGHVIGIDPGHQGAADIMLEPIFPASTLFKPRMSGGAIGVKTGVEESLLNLLIALKLQKALSDAGATVVMARSSQTDSLSNAERAELMNQNNVELWIRLHCDASSDASLSGACALIPSAELTPAIHPQSAVLASAVLSGFCAATGAKDLGICALDNQTGFNWSNSPVVTLEMGYLSNPFDDVRLNRDAYQNTCVKGIVGGLEAYFSGIS